MRCKSISPSHRPTPQPKEIHAAYETNRREATEELLHLVAAAMRSVWTLNRGTKPRPTKNSGVETFESSHVILWNDWFIGIFFCLWPAFIQFTNGEFSAWIQFSVLLLWMIWTFLLAPPSKSSHMIYIYIYNNNIFVLCFVWLLLDTSLTHALCDEMCEMSIWNFIGKIMILSNKCPQLVDTRCGSCTGI